MPGEVTCFLLTRTDREQRALRRFAPGPCPAVPSADSYHDAMVPIGVFPVALTERNTAAETPAAAYQGDPRWPTQCACGYAFQPGDTWQVFAETLWRREDTGAETTLSAAEPGAMWYADWMLLHRDQTYRGPGEFVGPDGHCLMVKCPDGHEWCVDSRASNGPGWTRTGTPPLVTANPSILHPTTGYHGWLRAGKLVPA